MKKKYWVCIIEPKTMDNFKEINKKVNGIDSVPRRAAMDALGEVGIEIKNCWSGWESDKNKIEAIQEVWDKETE